MNCWNHSSKYISVSQNGFELKFAPVQADIISNTFSTTLYMQSTNNIIFTHMPNI